MSSSREIFFGGGMCFLARGISLTWVLEVRQNILCVFATLPWQGQMSFHRLHSSSMHISVWKTQRQKINMQDINAHTHPTYDGSITNSNNNSYVEYNIIYTVGVGAGRHRHLHAMRAHTDTHRQSSAGGTGWSTPGEMSENGAEKEIQSFLSDGAALPREPEMRTRRFAHSTRLHAQPYTKKNPFVTRNQAKPARSESRARFQSQHVFACLYRAPLRTLHLQPFVSVTQKFIWVFIFLRLHYPKWQAEWCFRYAPHTASFICRTR